jgi:hypothetical protein
MDKDIVNCRRKHQNTLCGELVLEEARTSCRQTTELMKE